MYGIFVNIYYKCKKKLTSIVIMCKIEYKYVDVCLTINIYRRNA